MLTTVYRIEDVDQGGVYRGSNRYYIPSQMDDAERHPIPKDDSKLIESFGYNYDTFEDEYFRFDLIDYNFGFSSIDQLRNWFYKDEWLLKLSEYFKVGVYTIDLNYVKMGHTQVCFRMNEAEEHVQHSIAEFFNL
jgi:hypothetical protein